MNKEELIIYAIRTSEAIKEEKKQELIDYASNLEKENEKNKHYKTLYQSLKKQKEELRDYLKARIEVCDNRLSSPFCNIEKATKERLILNQCLDKLEEIESDNDEL